MELQKIRIRAESLVFPAGSILGLDSQQQARMLERCAECIDAPKGLFKLVKDWLPIKGEIVWTAKLPGDRSTFEELDPGAGYRVPDPEGNRATKDYLSRAAIIESKTFERLQRPVIERA